jgi:hypothetical protein
VCAEIHLVALCVFLISGPEINPEKNDMEISAQVVRYFNSFSTFAVQFFWRGSSGG